MNYVLPVSTTPLPQGLTLTQFLQTVLVGISGVPGSLVRPKWQEEAPEQPDIDVNWIAFGIDVATPDANSYLAINSGSNTASQRHEILELGLSIYGPLALEIYGLIRDGFQIEANRYALFQNNIGFMEVGPSRHLPELINERWFNRSVFSIFLRREIQRVYGVQNITSANGIIYVPDVSENYELPWEVAS